MTDCPRFPLPVVATRPNWHRVVPHVLDEPSLPVDMDSLAVREVLQEVVGDMFAAMYAQFGFGLAAPQLGIRWRLVVVDTLYRNMPDGRRLLLINPRLVETSEEETEVGLESCLSLPQLEGDVPRFQRITVENRTPANGVEYVKADGFLARLIQHEIDHLDGLLYLDRLGLPDDLRPVPGGLPAKRAAGAIRQWWAEP